MIFLRSCVHSHSWRHWLPSLWVCWGARGQRRTAGPAESAESGKQLEAKGGWGRGTKLTCTDHTNPSFRWLRPKRARHFLGRARVCSQPCQRGIGQRASRAGRQSRAQKEEVISVLASHRYPTVPTGKGLSMAQEVLVGGHGPKAKVSEKAGHPVGSIEAGENGGVEGSRP